MIETAFIQCHKSVLKFIQEVANTTDYTNPEIVVTFADIEEGGDAWGEETDEKKLEIMTKDEFNDMVKSDEATPPKDAKKEDDEV